MIHIIKSIDFNEKSKTDELYNFFKSNSSKINTEIYDKIHHFDKISDFFQYYTNSEAIDFLRLLDKIKSVSIKNKDEVVSSLLNSNTEQYLSCLTRIFLSLKLLQKTQETMNKLLTFYKQILLELKNEKKIENFNLNDLFSYIDYLIDTSKLKLSENVSRESTFKGSSLDSSTNFIVSDKFMNEVESETQSLDEVILTPKFNNVSEYNVEEKNEIKNNDNVKRQIFKDFTLKKNSTSSLNEIEYIGKENGNLNGEKTLKKFNNKKSNIKHKEKKPISVTDIIQINSRNNSEKNLKLCIENKEDDKKSENKLVDLLEMINALYRKCLIKPEEKIKLKKLVMMKSKKLFDLYNNYYLNIYSDEKILIDEIRKLFNDHSKITKVI